MTESNIAEKVKEFYELQEEPKPLPKMLFLDDRTKRIETAMRLYAGKYDLTIVTNVKECLRYLCNQAWDIVSLDHDLDGDDFQNPDDTASGMEVVRYIVKCDWNVKYARPFVWVHTCNLFAANLMIHSLHAAGISAIHRPFNWKQYQVGVVAGAFSVIHPGYIYLLKEARELCHRVVIALHDKPDQVLSVEERTEILLAFKYVDEVHSYKTESELDALLDKLNPDIRIVGSDHEASTSRPKWNTHYHNRNHDWSATKFKELIYQEVTQ